MSTSRSSRTNTRRDVCAAKHLARSPLQGLIMQRPIPGATREAERSATPILSGMDGEVGAGEVKVGVAESHSQAQRGTV